MIWHEGYHHGQMKLALKVAGHPFTNEEIGPVTWDIWMRKKRAGVPCRLVLLFDLPLHYPRLGVISESRVRSA
jgi:hypothetical protein